MSGEKITSEKLPEGWRTTSFSQVCLRITDGTHHSPKVQHAEPAPKRFKYITSKNIRPWGLSLEDLTYVDENVHREIYSRCNPEYGDVLLTKDGANTGIVAINTLREEFSLLSSVALLKVNPDLVDPRFLKYYITSPNGSRSLLGGMTGSAIRRIILRQINEAPLALAPLAEQKRIADKLEAVLGRVDACRTRLDRVPALLKRFRQSVLAAAVSGKLTEEWRMTNGAKDERNTVSKPLIVVESGQWPFDEIPSGWRWMEFQAIFNDETDSKRKLPQKNYDVIGKYPVVDQGERLVGGFTSQSELVSESSPPVIVFGDHTQCVKWVDFKFVQGADGVKVLQPNLRNVTARYGYFAMLGCDIPDKGYSRHMKFLKATCFPVPPPPEQQEIVRRVEDLFAFADSIEARLATAQKTVERLTPATLAKAFRGELVPQDPNDEPSSFLLERLQSTEPIVPAGSGRRKAAR